MHLKMLRRCNPKKHRSPEASAPIVVRFAISGSLMAGLQNAKPVLTESVERKAITALQQGSDDSQRHEPKRKGRH